MPAADRSYRYVDIAEQLRSEIVSGKLAEGTLLPSEAELSRTHDASRATIRKALDALRTDGVVDSRQGFGWFVGSSAVPQTLDALDTIEHQLSAAGMTSRREVMRFGFVDAPPEIRAWIGSPALEVTRLTLADDQPFALVTVWCRDNASAHLSRDDVANSTFIELLADQIGPASQRIGATAADTRVADTLGLEPGAPLLRVQRVTQDTGGQVLLVSEHLYPAHRTEFHVTLAARHPDTPAGLRLVDD